ncbi:HpcH/HpaI aldolase/citrate lyase family protein [Mariniplasma anaerobium]|uniref:Citrate lyase subunit beta n=1 Tax=Mariniplasma anaerobium TaxID=2735436 RepID=A0A7U9TKH3_9MOLU|nr:CoA ester lyase [Mariniplasma anaerobium]BCR35273.1 citrate lyase subunit beta [Mariniplasma anaerobium]
MRKSLLFIPANHPAMLQNADIFESDSVIFDLEDGVHLTEKDAAKDLLISFLDTFKLSDLEIIIRINKITDLKEIMHEQIDTILLPKADQKSLLLLDQTLTTLEKKFKLKKKIGIIALIETPESVLNALDIAKQKRVNGLLLGAEDLATYLGVSRTLEGHEIEFARNMVIYAAKTYQIDAIDTPFVNTNDLSGLKQDTLYAKSLGMSGKACIHPNQIDLINTLFLPSIEDIKYAQKILLAKEKADQEGLGAFSVDGKMIDQPIIKRAQNIIEKSKG